MITVVIHVYLFVKTKLKKHTSSVQTKMSQKLQIEAEFDWMFCLANVLWIWFESCMKVKSPCWGSCQSPFHCSAFICLQVNVVTKLGIELDLQIPQHLLYCWHSLLKTFNLLLQFFLITEHENANYMTASKMWQTTIGLKETLHLWRWKMYIKKKKVCIYMTWLYMVDMLTCWKKNLLFSP